MGNTTFLNQSLDVQESFRDVDTWLRAVNGVVMALILSFSIVGNTTVILLVLFHKKLQYRSVIVSMGLVVADLLVAIIWTSQSLIATVVGYWPFGDIACNILGVIWLWVLYVKWLESAVVSLDRFFIITYPFIYHKHSKPILIALTVLAWLVPLMFITPATVMLDPFKFRIVVTTCTVDCLSGQHGEECFPYFAGLFSLFVTIGGVVPTILYLIMYFISRQKRKAMRHRLGTQEGTERRTVTRTDSSSTTSSISSVNDTTEHTSNTATQSSSGRVLKKWLRSRDQRALSTFFIVFLTLLLTQIPLIVIGGLRENEDVYKDIPMWVHFIATYISLLSPALDPIVVMRNRDFRQVIKRVIDKRKRIPFVLMSEKKKLEFRTNSSLPIRQEKNNGHQPKLETVMELCSLSSRESTLDCEEADSINNSSLSETPTGQLTPDSEASPVPAHMSLHHVKSTE